MKVKRIVKRAVRRKKSGKRSCRQTASERLIQLLPKLHSSLLLNMSPARYCYISEGCSRGTEAGMYR
jgi:hypothetical protein